ncbi:MAG TPA: hypothetical protein VMG32_12320 [Anaeromyxobacteraceae bacterium]|nr:hypothetical protein [Anaeromyxobacteraceae bacterium]
MVKGLAEVALRDRTLEAALAVDPALAGSAAPRGLPSEAHPNWPREGRRKP